MIKKTCQKCNQEKTILNFDRQINVCKRCIMEITTTPITKNQVVKNYADYLAEDLRKKHGKL